MKLLFTALLIINFGLHTYGQEMEDSPTFNRNVLPIFQTHCSTCHHSASYIPDWTTYETSYMMRDRIMARVYEARNMPPGNRTQMTDEERTLVAEWISAGAPR